MPVNLRNQLEQRARRIRWEACALVAVARAGMLGVERPRTLKAMVDALHGYGSLGGATRLAALRHGGRAAVADERGEIAFAELDERVNRLANALRTKIAAGSTIGILCRNHRQPLIAAFAASRAGMNAVWLNTAFSARQLAEVADREGVELLVHDAEFADLVAGLTPRYGRVACAIDAPEHDELDHLLAVGEPTLPPAPARPGKLVLLTSGTSGTPKGAPRAEPKGLILPGALLQRMPMRAREATVIGPPLYHGTGLSIAVLSLGLGSKLVLRRRFDPAEMLDDIESHRATAVCLVPVMLQRIVALGAGEVRRRDLRCLRVAFCAGSQLPAEVAIRATELLGDVIYNLYGSTEVSVATLATPDDLRAAPTSVGRPALGSTVRVLDDAGVPVARTGQTGRVFVGTTTPFEGYTGGGGKDVIGGLMPTGDLGHFDGDGRLYIDGRGDEMIISGGENVFPGEIEELLMAHPAIADVAAIGVDDADFGQRLRAFVVLRDGEQLSAEGLQTFVKENLARYKAPRDVVFLDELPRNPTGKILKRELATRKD